ncbi:MAG: hypothetical protein ACRDIB_18610, partial [Ardenticatenaceae bacterium]
LLAVADKEVGLYMLQQTNVPLAVTLDGLTTLPESPGFGAALALLGGVTILLAGSRLLRRKW